MLANDTIVYWEDEQYGITHYLLANTSTIPLHRHLYLEVFIYLSGKIQYVIEGKTYTLERGDIILIGPDDLHHPIYDEGEPYERIVLYYYPKFMNSFPLDEENRLDKCFQEASKNSAHILRLQPHQINKLFDIIANIKHEAQTSHFAGRQMIKNYFIQFLIKLNRYYAFYSLNPEVVEISFDVKIDKIVQYINENLSEELSLDSLAKEFYMSKYYLLNEFKKYTGFTVHNFISKKRLLLSKMLLSQGKSLKSVVGDSGYNDYSNFLRAFKKEFGVSPMNFVKTFKAED